MISSHTLQANSRPIQNQVLSIKNNNPNFDQLNAFFSSNQFNQSSLAQSLFQLIKALLTQLKPADTCSNSTPKAVIQPNQAVQAYLDKNYGAGAKLLDVDRNGLISAGDRISYSDNSGSQKTVIIDQTLAQTLNSLDSTQSPPGSQGIIQPSQAVQAYLDKNYGVGAELFDVDGDGLISKGDHIVYDNGSAFQQVVTIDQTLAQTLNSLDSTQSPPSFQPSQAVQQYLDNRYGAGAKLPDVDGNGVISAGDRITSSNGVTVTIDSVLAQTLNGLDWTPSQVVQQYLDNRYGVGAKLFDIDADGLISAGDLITYPDENGLSSQQVDQYLADRLNALPSLPGAIIPPSPAAQSYLNSNYGEGAKLIDVNGNGFINAGDQITSSDGSTVSIDSVLAQILEGVGSTQSPPGAQGIIQPSQAVQQYLDNRYSVGAELFDVDGDGVISVGDQISYLHQSGLQHMITIDQVLAEKLNSL
ncbi:MAG: hypothetical protein ACH34X_02850 [Thiolinea sp.]